jgi:hypothetical protein
MQGAVKRAGEGIGALVFCAVLNQTRGRACLFAKTEKLLLVRNRVTCASGSAALRDCVAGYWLAVSPILAETALLPVKAAALRLHTLPNFPSMATSLVADPGSENAIMQAPTRSRITRSIEQVIRFLQVPPEIPRCLPISVSK